MTRPKAAELVFIEALLRMLAETTEDELDAGRWTRRVQTIDGPIDLTLSLPSILDDEGVPASARSAPRPSRTFGEQVQQRVQRFLAENEFGSMDEANAALSKALEEGLFDGDEDRATNRPLTDAERAQDLAHEAIDAVGRLRVKLARQALAISADCADAWIVLGDSMGDAEAAIGQYERAMEAAARTLGPDRFEALAGEFWGHLDTRPYMRARLALADALAAAGRADEAVGHFQEMLRLNPGDNQGVRYLLLPLVLRLGRDAEAADLLAAYEDDVQATWPYGRALLTYRREGDSAPARRALADAVAANRHVVDFLIDPDQMPPGLPPHFALGSEEEAIAVAHELAAVVDAIPGAMDWLARNGRVLSQARGRRKSRGRGRARAKGRRRR
jgi:tetratricopeptide (TPR) repeat protein